MIAGRWIYVNSCDCKVCYNCIHKNSNPWGRINSKRKYHDNTISTTTLKSLFQSLGSDISDIFINDFRTLSFIFGILV